MASGARLTPLLCPLCGAGAGKGALGTGMPKRAGNASSQGGEARLSTPGWVTYSLSPLCSGSELALGVHVGKPQPLLTFPAPKAAAAPAARRLVDVGPKNPRHAGTALDGPGEGSWGGRQP